MGFSFDSVSTTNTRKKKLAPFLETWEKKKLIIQKSVGWSHPNQNRGILERDHSGSSFDRSPGSFPSKKMQLEPAVSEGKEGKCLEGMLSGKKSKTRTWKKDPYSAAMCDYRSLG